MSCFAELISEASRLKQSKVVLALDVKGPQALERSKRILEEVSSYVCAVKVNKHLILPLGLRGLRGVVDRAHELGLPVIADCKMCDIGSTNVVEASLYFNAGFDAITVMPLPGWSDGLEGVFELARKEGRGVILVVQMSHVGTSEFFEAVVFDERWRIFDNLYKAFARRAAEWGADAVIVGATRPDLIRRVKEIVADKFIFAPGVAVQGGDATEALTAGASYIIVGRAICESHDPSSAARQFQEITKQFL